jgi:hypothetical protein
VLHWWRLIGLKLRSLGWLLQSILVEFWVRVATLIEFAFLFKKNMMHLESVTPDIMQADTPIQPLAKRRRVLEKTPEQLAVAEIQRETKRNEKEEEKQRAREAT